MIEDFSKLPPIPEQYTEIHKQYYSETHLITPSINLLEQAFMKAFDYGNEKQDLSAYNDWIDYLALTCNIYGSACIKRLIVNSKLKSVYKRHIIRDLEHNSSSRSVRDFVLLLLTEMYGYHAKIVDIALSNVSTDAYIGNITDSDAFDEITLLGFSLKPKDFDDVLWEQFIWSYV